MQLVVATLISAITLSLILLNFKLSTVMLIIKLKSKADTFGHIIVSLLLINDKGKALSQEVYLT